MTTHQSHEGEKPGQTNSSYKLERLRMPSTLQGKRILDIGCNEGFFCNAAAQRGATAVIGIDMNHQFLAEAERRYASNVVSFRKQSWSTLPDGPFDLILWTSAMHYELDPAKILRQVHKTLAPDGLFILECGVLQTPRCEMIYSVRHDGGLWYPTQPFLDKILSETGFVFREVSHSEIVGTDPIPRSVFHAHRRKPSVLLIIGESRKGKTNLSFALRDSATKVISLDHFVSRIGCAKWAVTPLQNLIKEKYDRDNLMKIYKGIDEADLSDDYVKLLASAVAETDTLVVFEGFLTARQMEGLYRELASRALVWSVERS